MDDLRRNSDPPGGRLNRISSLRLLALALVVTAPARAQVAPEAAAHVIGVVCLDLDDDGACGPSDEPLKDQRVLTDDGLVSSTDGDGRFSLAAVAARSEGSTFSGARVERLTHTSVRLSPRGLGPGAVVPAPVVVDAVPGSVAHVDIAVRAPAWRDAPWLTLGPTAGLPLGVFLREGRPHARVLGRAPPGHAVFVAGERVELDDDGGFALEVPLGDRFSQVAVADVAPDGRVRGQQLELETVQHAGERISVFADVSRLFTVDLPRPGSSVAGARLRVPFAIESGVVVDAAGETLRDRGVRWVPLDLREPLRLVARRAGRDEPALALGIDFERKGGEPLLGAMLDLRVGWAGNLAALNDVPSAFFVDGALRGAGSVTLGPVELEGAARIDDGQIGDGLAGRVSYAPSRTLVLERWLGFEAPPLLGDDSETRALNPAGLPFTGRARAFGVEAGVGATRSGLDDGLTGRLDRPMAGAWIDAAPELGPIELSVEGGADVAAGSSLFGAGPEIAAGFRAAHAELLGTGGSVYRLPHRDVVTGSERLQVDTRDPLTGFVRTRRTLRRGRDYDIDYRSGLVLLAAPLGREGIMGYGRLSSGDVVGEHVLVADYGVTDIDAVGGTLAVQPRISAFGVELAGRAATHPQEEWGLLGVEARVAPFEWLDLEASASTSAGEPYVLASDFQRSYDGGTSFATPTAAPADGGNAWAARARLGDESAGLFAFVAGRDGGYRDGATRADGRATQAGVEASFDAGFARTQLGASARDARTPFDPDGQRARVIGAQLRAEVPVARALVIAAEGVSRDVDLYEGRLDTSGRAVGAGVEAIVHALPELDLTVGHMQGIWSLGTGPGARDPTVTSVGATFHDDAGSVGGRVGLRPDGTITAAGRWSRPEDDGSESYGSFGMNPDDPFAPAGTQTVTGARAAALPGVHVFTESRLRSDPLFGTSAGQALGGELGRGPLRAAAHYERSRRVFFATGGETEGGHLRLGLELPGLSANAFGEARRGGPGGLDDGALSAFGGGALRLRLLRDLELGGRTVVGQSLVDANPLLYARVAGSYRPSLPFAVLADYALRQDLAPVTRDDGRLALQQHRATLRTVLGRLPGMNAVLTARGRHTRILDGDEGLATTAGAFHARGGLPLWLIEPAIEVGARVIGGGGLGFEPGLTARAELAVLLGPVRTGFGVVAAGYTGDGIEDPALGLDPPQRFYGFVQGVL